MVGSRVLHEGNMICFEHNQQGAEILMDYCAGKLDPVRASELAAHLQECAECRKLADAQSAVWEMLEVWKPIEVSSDFDAKLYARIARELREPAWLRWSRRIFRPATPRPFWKPVASLAAVGAVLFLAVMRMPDTTSHVPSDPSFKAQVSSEKIDVDQVEQALEDLDMLAPVGQAPSSKL
jgi:anti-sigma factor RsiW